MAVLFGHLNENERKDMVPLTSTDGKRQAIWVDTQEWVSPYEIISDGSEVPKEIRTLIKKWSKQIAQLEKDFDYKWYIKHTAVEFIFGEKYYKLRPSSVAASHELFDHVDDGIQSDLNQIGCPYIRYISEID